MIHFTDSSTFGSFNLVEANRNLVFGSGTEALKPHRGTTEKEGVPPTTESGNGKWEMGKVGSVLYTPDGGETRRMLGMWRCRTMTLGQGPGFLLLHYHHPI